jgi:hypothetical protein
MSQVACTDKHCAPDHTSSHVRPCTDADRLQSHLEPDPFHVKFIPCPFQVLFDNPLQDLCPFSITVVVDSIKISSPVGFIRWGVRSSLAEKTQTPKGSKLTQFRAPIPYSRRQSVPHDVPAAIDHLDRVSGWILSKPTDPA